MRRLLRIRNALTAALLFLPIPKNAAAVDPALLPPAEPELQLIGKPFTITSPDGVRLTGREHVVEDSTGTVIMVPMLGNTMESYARFADEVRLAGLSVLSYDLRGHGESTKSTSGTLNYSSFRPADWDFAVEDLALFIQHVKKRNDRIQAIIGAGIGADAALIAGAADSEIPRLMLISPGEVKTRHDLLSAASKLEGRDIVLMCATADDLTVSVTQEIHARAAAAGAKSTLDLIPAVFHGTTLILPAFRGNIIDWLNGGAYVPFDVRSKKP